MVRLMDIKEKVIQKLTLRNVIYTSLYVNLYQCMLKMYMKGMTPNNYEKHYRMLTQMFVFQYQILLNVLYDKILMGLH